MSRRKLLAKSESAQSLDLQAFHETLGRLLPALLFSRDGEALVRWSKVRSWIDNALAGEASPELQTIDLAIAYLIERAEDCRRHAK
jgi:hypothetical protein